MSTPSKSDAKSQTLSSEDTPKTDTSKSKPSKSTSNGRKKAPPAKPAQQTSMRSIGRRTAILFALCAAGLGAIGGAALSYVINPPVSEFNPAPLEAALDELRSDQAAIKAQINRLETAQKSQTSVNLRPLQNRLQSLESRLDKLSSIEGVDGNTAAALAEIVTRLDGLETNALSSDAQIDPAVLNKALARLDILEGQLERSQSVAQPLDMPAFPEAEVRAALRSFEDSDKSWLQKTLGSHISVRKPGELDTVSRIIAAIDSQDIAAAIAEFETLPEPVQNAAQGWAQFVNTPVQTQTQIETPEQMQEQAQENEE